MPRHHARGASTSGAVLIAALLAGCEPPPPVAPTEPGPGKAAATDSSAKAAVAPASDKMSVDEAALDTSVSACDDFYRYACGGWIKSTPIPDDKAAWFRSFDTMDERNLEELHAILERYAKGEGKGEPYAQKLGDYYASCMDEPAIEKAGTTALKPDFDMIDKIKTPKDLAAAVGTLHVHGVNAIFHFTSSQDAKDATQVIGELAQGGLGLPEREYYRKDDEATKKLRDSYEAHIQRMLELLGDKPSDAKASAAIVMRVERALAEASMKKEDLREPHKVYHRIERAGLEKTAPDFAWGQYLEKVGAPSVTAINVAQPDFMKAVSAAMTSSTFDCTDGDAKAASGGKEEKGAKPAAKPCPKPAKKFPAAEWKTYLRWRTISAAAESLSQKFVDESFRFEKAVTGAEKLEPRWKRCVRSTDVVLGEALAQPFVKKMLGEEGKASVKAMVVAIETAMKDNIDHLSWMDGETRKRALEKLGAIVNKIGFPDKWRSYEALTVVRGDHAGNRQRGIAFELKRLLDKVGKPLDRSEWQMTPPTINAYYEPALNEIVFPAGILETPFYSSKASYATNLGAIGMVIGHEITHGFDDQGRQYDEKGNLRDWWTPKVDAEFTKRASCVEQQYNDYVAIDNLHVNGKLTLGENIADLGGLRIAYAALRKSLDSKPREAGKFSPEQQFFLGFAQGWCANVRPQILSLLVKTDPHSPPNFRVNGPVSNLPEFAEAFQCKAGSPMVRKDRCEVW